MRVNPKLLVLITLAAVVLRVSIYANAKPIAVNIASSGVQERGKISVQNYSTEATINQAVNSLLQKEVVDGVERYNAKGGLPSYSMPKLAR